METKLLERLVMYIIKHCFSLVAHHGRVILVFKWCNDLVANFKEILKEMIGIKQKQLLQTLEILQS